MLVLSRKPSEILEIGPNIVIRVIAIGGGKVRLGIEAPSEVRILRGEVANRQADRPAKEQLNQRVGTHPQSGIAGGRMPRAA